jgi:hypothetical protein
MASTDYPRALTGQERAAYMLLLFLDDGWLASLELVSPPPSAFNPPRLTG